MNFTKNIRKNSQNKATKAKSIINIIIIFKYYLYDYLLYLIPIFWLLRYGITTNFGKSLDPHDKQREALAKLSTAILF